MYVLTQAGMSRTVQVCRAGQTVTVEDLVCGLSILMPGGRACEPLCCVSGVDKWVWCGETD